MKQTHDYYTSIWPQQLSPWKCSGWLQLGCNRATPSLFYSSSLPPPRRLIITEIAEQDKAGHAFCSFARAVNGRSVMVISVAEFFLPRLMMSKDEALLRPAEANHWLPATASACVDLGTWRHGALVGFGLAFKISKFYKILRYIKYFSVCKKY